MIVCILPQLVSLSLLAPQIPSPKSRNTKLQGVPVGGQGNQPQQPSPTQPTSHPKFSSYTPVAALVSSALFSIISVFNAEAIYHL